MPTGLTAWLLGALGAAGSLFFFFDLGLVELSSSSAAESSSLTSNAGRTTKK